MPAHQYKYLFGPVPSRRFGRSLGVDLTPFKTCSLDCVSCQLARTTTHHTARRSEYVPSVSVLEEIDRWLANGGQADVITFAGSGEPTLHSGLGGIARHIRWKDVPDQCRPDSSTGRRNILFDRRLPQELNLAALRLQTRNRDDDVRKKGTPSWIL